MKKLLFSLFAVLAMATPQKMFAQLTVADPTQTAINKAGWTESLSKTATQIKELQEQKNLLTQTVELYTKVSGVISNSVMVKNIIDRQVNMLKSASTAFSIKRENIADVSTYQRFAENMQSYIAQSNTTISGLKTVISPSTRMSDGERFKFLRELDSESKSIEMKMNKRINYFNQLNNDLRLLKSLKE